MRSQLPPQPFQLLGPAGHADAQLPVRGSASLAIKGELRDIKVRQLLRRCWHFKSWTSDSVGDRSGDQQVIWSVIEVARRVRGEFVHVLEKFRDAVIHRPLT